MTEKTPLLDVHNLRVQFGDDEDGLVAVRNSSFSVSRGECLGIVGESGSGKSLTCLSLLDLVPAPGRVTGNLRLAGRSILGRAGEELRSLRGNEVAMIFQDPNSALNPLISVRRQMTDVIRAHQSISRAEAKQRAVEVLKSVKFPDPEERINSYPFELSGGLKQRVAIALALSCKPLLVMADEPTTSLDVSTQEQVLRVFRERLKGDQFAAIFVSHDLNVVGEVADRLQVMYAGTTVETGSAKQVLENPIHPYTRGLLASAPTLESSRARRLVGIPGSAPDLTSIPSGCAFQARCQERDSGLCHPNSPRWAAVPDEPGHRVYCFAPEGMVI